MSDEEICEMMGWPRRAAALLADYPDGLLGRICAVAREAERREREACAKVCGSLDETDMISRYDYRRGVLDCADAIRARGNK